MFDHYLTIARPWLEQYGYLALFGAVFVEGFGIPAPGETLIIASGLLANQGDLNIAAVLLTAWAAAVLGDNIGYMLGRWGGQRLLSKFGVQPRHLKRAEDYFEKFGGAVIIVARFVEGLRQLNGFVAGSMGMSWLRFIIFNATGAALWVGLWGGGVWWFSSHFEKVEQTFHKFEPLIFVMGITALITLIWYLFRPSRTKNSTS